MAEKFNKENLSPQNLAKQLRKPEGEVGKKVGEQMNNGNKHICMNSYKMLDPKDGDSILEIGMGNGLFVKDLLHMANGVDYIGIDYSKTMVEEAIALNEALPVRGKSISFLEGSVEKLPFEDNRFDAITTTNTVYFWPDPFSNIKELYRVLKPGGRVLIAYRSKEFLDNLELARFGFSKYGEKGVEDILGHGGLEQIGTEVIDEPELEFDGKVFSMRGLYTTGFKPKG